ncbi:MAG: hypothetical protein IKH75_10300 [Ruminococcus sp.]|nr:hypothetical protein [Ruminococcus sp.]
MAGEENFVIGWDDEIEESSSFELMPDGDYWFEVTGFEREWWQPANPDTSRIKACNQASLDLAITWKNEKGEDKVSKLKYKLKITDSLTFLIFQFFEAVGLRKKGEGSKLKLSLFNQVIGKTGICEIGHREGTKGGTFNEVKRCYAPEDAPTVTKNSKEPSPTFSL